MQLVMATESAAGISRASAFDDMDSTPRHLETDDEFTVKDGIGGALQLDAPLVALSKRDERRLQSVMETKRSWREKRGCSPT